MKKATKRKLLMALRATFRYPQLGLSYLFPRNPGKWLFGCRTGFMDNPKYLFLQALADGRKRCIWMARNGAQRDRLKALGLPVCYRYSPAGIWHTLTAGYEFFSHYANDINYWLSGGARKVMLWHGVGLKRVGNHAGASRLDRLLAPELFDVPYRFLAPSPFMARHFSRCLDIPAGRMVEATYPRNDIFGLPHGELRALIRRYDPALDKALPRPEAGTRLYLYMPTFRETGEDFLAAAGFDFAALDALMEKLNGLFLLKLHPFTRWNAGALRAFSHIVVLPNDIDVYPLLPLTHTLVTDYSSIYYDYILIPGKRVVLFPFDREDYLARCRDLMYDFDEYTPGRRAHTFDELLRLLESNGQSCTDDADIQRVRQLFWATDRRLYPQIG